MGIPDGIETKITGFCHKRSPLEYKDKLRITYTIERNSIVIREERPGWRDPAQWTAVDIAKLSFIQGKWNLYCKFRDRKWHKCPDTGPSEEIDDLLREIDEDPTGIFWG